MKSAINNLRESLWKKNSYTAFQSLSPMNDRLRFLKEKLFYTFNISPKRYWVSRKTHNYTIIIERTKLIIKA